ncbi:MAG: pyruvate kinase [Myxococcales bacterium]|nr:pyruvate kinase [Myxococcales bacterium]
MSQKPETQAFRRTKIVATLGPASSSEETLAAMIRAGLDVARINFSHGSSDEHRQRIELVRRLSADARKPVAVMIDLPGPKIRALIPEAITLVTGQLVHFALRDDAEAAIGTTLPEALMDVRPGERILLDDGRILLNAQENDGRRLSAVVQIGGQLKPRKGINLPDTKLSIPTLTADDQRALDCAVEYGADWVALSFVRDSSAALTVRNALAARGAAIPVIAKIERPEAVENIDAIVAAFDGIMVARGDLGVEMPLEDVPRIQKLLITAARVRGKPVITATEMLESMKENPRPTRAEAGDVANAILDGTDAVMLSVETAAGRYPVEAVQYMARIALATDRRLGERFTNTVSLQAGRVIDSITHAACVLADTIDARAVVIASRTGRTVRLTARHRPQQLIVAATNSVQTLNQLALVWGVYPLAMPELAADDDRLERATARVHEAAIIPRDARMVLVAEHPVMGREATPTLRVTGLREDEIT